MSFQINEIPPVNATTVKLTRVERQFVCNEYFWWKVTINSGYFFLPPHYTCSVNLFFLNHAQTSCAWQTRVSDVDYTEDLELEGSY